MIESLFDEGMLTLDRDAEYALRHDDFVMEMPQSGERIRGRETMRAMQEGFPNPPVGTLRRIVGSGDVWVAEGVNDYGDDVWHWVVVIEFDDGRFRRETRYYGKPFPAPDWRAPYSEPMSD